jgi:hypothetical protein
VEVGSICDNSSRKWVRYGTAGRTLDFTLYSKYPFWNTRADTRLLVEGNRSVGPIFGAAQSDIFTRAISAQYSQ